MNCPQCDGKTKVADSRSFEKTVERRRVCPSCGHEFHTSERVFDVMDDRDVLPAISPAFRQAQRALEEAQSVLRDARNDIENARRA